MIKNAAVKYLIILIPYIVVHTFANTPVYTDLFIQSGIYEEKIKFDVSDKPSTTLPSSPTDLTHIFADVTENILPCVVSIVPTKIDTITVYTNPFYNFFNEPFSSPEQNQSFPDRFDNKKDNKTPPKEQEYRSEGLGSGVIISNDGYIITNFHVVSDATHIEVHLYDGRNFTATIIGSDSLTDIAVLKIKENVNNLPVAPLGNSSMLRPGDWVIAIGNPFNLNWSVTVGVVSALGRKLDESTETYQDFIQTDAAINPGNSGGALVDINGTVIGINAMIYSNSGGFMGIGFAIPINMVNRIVKDLVSNGEFIRGWIGVSIQAINSTARNALDLENLNTGVIVTEVYNNQPAQLAGIRQGDVIMTVGDAFIESPNTLRNTVALLQPDSTVSITIFRNGKEIPFRVLVKKRNEADSKETVQSAPISKKWKIQRKSQLEQICGIVVENITRKTIQKYQTLDPTNGVFVVSSSDTLKDDRSRLREGDIIKQIKIERRNMKEINSVNDFRRIMDTIKTGESALMLIKRKNYTFYLSFVN